MTKNTPTKDGGHNNANRNKFNMWQENNDIVKSSVIEILLQEKLKLSAEEEAHENIESNFDENEIYHINKTSLEYKK